MKTALEEFLTGWLRNGGPLELPEDCGVHTDAEARLVCAVLDKAIADIPVNMYATPKRYDIHSAVVFFQSVRTREAGRRMRKDGLPRLRAIVRDYFERHHVDKDAIMFIAKILASYGDPEDAPALVRLARKPACETEWLWSVIFQELTEAAEPTRQPVIEGLRDPLPRKFCRVAFLNFCNLLARNGSLASHPYDSPEGHASLKQWLLTCTDEEDWSYAVSAASALPFLDTTIAAELAAIARAHPSAAVRLEEAWAAAKLGQRAGLERLVGFAGDPLYATQAIRYLEALGQAARAPAQARSPEGQALAEMADWLTQPSELGRPPEEVSLADARELYWPPLDERRQLFVIRYKYRWKGEPREAFGLVGTTGGCTMPEDMPVNDPLEVYALHCCWELQTSLDPRAPTRISVAAGRRILADQNPEFRLRIV